MQLAVELFTNSAKADIFLSLKAGSRRDRWLETLVGIWKAPAVIESLAAETLKLSEFSAAEDSESESLASVEVELPDNPIQKL